MPRGRKKKVINVESADLFSDIELTKKSYYKCDICCSITRIPLMKLNLSHFLCKASYYRKCKLDNINICDKCSSELSSLVDDWIIRKNKDLEKFRQES